MDTTLYTLYRGHAANLDPRESGPDRRLLYTSLDEGTPSALSYARNGCVLSRLVWIGNVADLDDPAVCAAISAEVGYDIRPSEWGHDLEAVEADDVIDALLALGYDGAIGDNGNGTGRDVVIVPDGGEFLSTAPASAKL